MSPVSYAQGMDFRIFTEPQMGGEYEDQLHLAQAAEQLGYSAFFRSDHYLAMGGRDGLPGPTDSWVTLAGLARETESIRLGTLVTSATFRHPGVLAIQVAQVDRMSGGRVEFGLGAGWFEAEHSAYGIPFPSRRFDRFEEQLEVITGLWSTPEGETFGYEGRHYRLSDSPALPKPVQQPVPLIIGGEGPRRTPALAARFASEFNCWVNTDEVLIDRHERVQHACAQIGRDPGELTFSLAAMTAIGPTDAAVAERAAAAGSTPERIRARGLAGTPGEVVDRLGRLRELGFSRVYLQLIDQRDLDHADFIAREVVPQLR